MTSVDDDIDCFQVFRFRVSPGLVRIPAIRHPIHGNFYVIWSDVRHCFPGVMRIQFDNIYVPMLRDDKTLLRIKPHGIRYHAGVVLDVIYNDIVSPSSVKKRRNKSSSQSLQEPIQQGGALSAPTTTATVPTVTPITVATATALISTTSQPQYHQHSLNSQQQFSTTHQPSQEQKQQLQLYTRHSKPATHKTSQELNHSPPPLLPIVTPQSSTLKFDPPPLQQKREQKQQQPASSTGPVTYRELRDIRQARGISTYPTMPGVTSHLVSSSRSPSICSISDDLNELERSTLHSHSQRSRTSDSGKSSSTFTGLTGAFTMSVPLPSQIAAIATTAASAKRSRDDPSSDYEQEASEGDDDYEDMSYGEDDDDDGDDFEVDGFIQYMNGDDQEDEEDGHRGVSKNESAEGSSTSDYSSDGSDADAGDGVSGQDISDNAENISGEDAEDRVSDKDGHDNDYLISPVQNEYEDLSDSNGEAGDQLKSVDIAISHPPIAPSIDLVTATAMTVESNKGSATSKAMTMGLTNSHYETAVAVAYQLPSGPSISSVPVINMTQTHPDVDTDLTWDRRSAIAETMRVDSTMSQPFVRPPRQGQLTVEDLIEHRVKNILMTRQRWIEAVCPRFFCILPTSDDAASRAPVTLTNWDPSTDIEATPLTMTLLNPPTSAPDSSVANFHFFFICDCCDVPGYEQEWFPHGTLKENIHNYDLTLNVVDDMVPKYGEYIMGVLEMLKYGVYINNRLKFPAQTDAEVQRRLSVAIDFLESRNILSSAKYYSQNLATLKKDPTGASLLAGLTPIEPLSKTMTKVLARRLEMTHVPLFEGMSPYRTKEGDVRWVCLPHWYDMSPQEEWAVLNKFQGNNQFIKSEYHTNLATFRAIAMNRAKAQEFYSLAGRMTTTCVFRLFCDFDMNSQDEAHLCEAVEKFAAACVHITVRPKIGVHDGAMHGFAKGYWTITLAALGNKKLEGFRLVQGISDDPPNFRAHYERSDLERSTTDHVRLLTRMKRSAHDKRLSVTMVVTDIDRAVNTVRRHVKGLHNFSKLILATDFAFNEVQARFARLESGVAGCDMEDTDYEGELESFFVRRGGCDTIKYTCIGMPDNQFLMSRALTTVQMAFSLVRDRTKVRELIKHSKALSSLTLQNSTRDDPSQIYENLKALLASHASLKELSVQHRQGNNRPSSFVWHSPNDLAKMRVHMSFGQGDKVRAMFQKYATSIEELTVDGIETADAAVFEKSMRTKKGPIKLCRMVLRGLHLWEPFALEEFKKVILRLRITEVTVSGGIDDHEEFPHDAQGKDGNYVAPAPVAPRARKSKGMSVSTRVSIWFEFIFAIRGCLTGINLWGKATTQLVQMLGTRLKESIQMPLLNELTLSGDWKMSLLHYPWIERLVEYKSESKRRPQCSSTMIEANTVNAFVSFEGLDAQPINMVALLVFDISRIPILDDEWERLLKHLDLYRLREFLIRQPNPMSPKTLAAIVDQVPRGSLLETFSIDEELGLSRDDVILQHRRIKETTSDKITIMINGYIVAP
ncbi:hypothetical protein BGZ96_004101 [Linnemannia gamsii]|uniref:Uncharacterized protein n=1 Tax=Linnemannia gamsii TaxID=64522 RepID=A0ABQ7K8K5_9FUNG|nr:hypothetical protein BGZ96_004101 [Linnemannia gamsii]